MCAIKLWWLLKIGKPEVIWKKKVTSHVTDAKCILFILKWNWYQRFGDNKLNLKIWDNMLTSTTLLQNETFHAVERTRTVAKCTPMKTTRAKLNHGFSFLNMQIWKVFVAIAVVVCISAPTYGVLLPAAVLHAVFDLLRETSCNKFAKLQ